MGWSHYDQYSIWAIKGRVEYLIHSTCEQIIFDLSNTALTAVNRSLSILNTNIWEDVKHDIKIIKQYVNFVMDFSSSSVEGVLTYLKGQRDEKVIHDALVDQHINEKAKAAAVQAAKEDVAQSAKDTAKEIAVEAAKEQITKFAVCGDV